MVRGPGGPFAVVVASSRDEAAAWAAAADVTADGFAAVVERTDLEDRGVWFRVVLDGGYPTLAAARAAAERVGGLGDGDAWVLRR
jgi:hypothetical protein